MPKLGRGKVSTLLVTAHKVAGRRVCLLKGISAEQLLPGVHYVSCNSRTLMYPAYVNKQLRQQRAESLKIWAITHFSWRCWKIKKVTCLLFQIKLGWIQSACKPCIIIMSLKGTLCFPQKLKYLQHQFHKMLQQDSAPGWHDCIRVARSFGDYLLPTTPRRCWMHLVHYSSHK